MSLEPEVWEAGGRWGSWFLGLHLPGPQPSGTLPGHVPLPGSHDALICVHLSVMGLSD